MFLDEFATLSSGISLSIFVEVVAFFFFTLASIFIVCFQVPKRQDLSNFMIMYARYTHDFPSNLYPNIGNLNLLC